RPPLRHRRGRASPPESPGPRCKGEGGERLDRDGNRARSRHLEPPDAICRQPIGQGHGPAAVHVVGPEPRPSRALRQSGGYEEDRTDQRVVAAGPRLGLRPDPDLPRRPPRRRGSVSTTQGKSEASVWTEAPEIGVAEPLIVTYPWIRPFGPEAHAGATLTRSRT